ncbi:MAG: peptidylprolyl isomerase [Pseudobdellovibrionaceae bacterium]
MSVSPAKAQDIAKKYDNPENILIMETSKGPVVIKMMPEVAPNHVARIKELTSEGFYDGIIFHRVIDGFMAQTGDPTGTGTGGSDKPDLKAEFNDTNFGRGAVGMARTNDPNSANSQFFVCFEDCSFLNKQYTVWGQVVEGMENVDKLNIGEPPAMPDKIVKMTLAVPQAVIIDEEPAANAASEGKAKTK